MYIFMWDMLQCTRASYGILLSEAYPHLTSEVPTAITKVRYVYLKEFPMVHYSCSYHT